MHDLEIGYEYGYVVCVVCMSWVLINWLSLEVVLARERYHIVLVMASLLEALPPDYGWVVLVFIASIFVVQWMGFQVGRARRKFGIKYPTMYSDKEPLFNCIQRAHQNTLEGYTVFVVLLLLGGIQYPRFCAACGVVYIISRIVYAKGYYTGEPKNRNRGAFGYLALLMLLGCNFSVALTLLGYI